MRPFTSASTFKQELRKTTEGVISILSLRIRFKMCGKCLLGDLVRRDWQNTTCIEILAAKGKNSFSLSRTMKMPWAF